MDNEQIIKLVLQLAGVEDADKLSAAMARINAAGDQAKGGVQGVDQALDALKDSGVETKLDAVDFAMDEVAQSSDRAAAGVKKFAAVQDQATSSKKAGAQALIELSRGLQDFQAAGLVGISNNIEGLTMSLGKFATGGVSLAAVLTSPAGIVAGLTLLTTALIAGGPTIKAYFDELIGGANKVPEATDSLQRLTDALKKTGGELGELKEKQSLTNAELARFGELTREQEELETRVAEERKARQIDAQLAAQQPKEKTERASAFREAVGEAGGGQAATGALRQALLNIANQTGQEYTLEGIAEQADQLMRDAAEGSRAARGNILRALRFGGEDAKRFGSLIRETDPVNKDIDKAQSELDAAAEQGERAEKARRDKKEAEDARNEKTRQGIVAAAQKHDEESAKQARAAQDEADKRRDSIVDELELNTGIDEMAAQYAATARARGGDFDPRTGKRTGRDPREALAADATAMARRAIPSLSPEAASSVGTEVSRRAFGQVDQVIEANRQGLNLSGRNLSAAQVNQNAIAATLRAVQMMGGRMDGVEQTARQLLSLAQEEVQRQGGRRRTILPRGR